MTADEAAVRAVLTDWYVAMRDHDNGGIASALSEEFLLVEHDAILRGPELTTMLMSESDATLIAELSDFSITVHGDVAWSTHRNHEVWTPAEGEALEMEFLETVVLVRTGGRWLMDRYHATRISPAVL